MQQIGKTIVYVGVIVLFALALVTLSHHDISREKATLQEAMERDVTAYYAREGHYPSSVEEIQQVYGLTYDEDQFYIGYELYGSNIRPYITIVEKGGQP